MKQLALALMLLCSAPSFAQAPNERLDVALKAYRLAATGYREGNVPLEIAAMWPTARRQDRSVSRAE